MPQIYLSDAHKQIGKQLRKLRKTSGKTINEAAIEAGVAPRTLSKIEDGEANFRILTLEKLLKAYKTDLSQLLGDLTLPALSAKQCSERKPKRKMA